MFNSHYVVYKLIAFVTQPSEYEEMSALLGIQTSAATKTAPKQQKLALAEDEDDQGM